MNAMRTLHPAEKQASVLVGQQEFMRRRLQRALKDRERYRYVEPEVHVTDAGYLVTSPCCSRNIDPEGGVIDIARIEQLGNSWLLYSCDHKLDMWLLHDEYKDLDTLLAVLCKDSERVFWP